MPGSAKELTNDQKRRVVKNTLKKLDLEKSHKQLLNEYKRQLINTNFFNPNSETQLLISEIQDQIDLEN